MNKEVKEMIADLLMWFDVKANFDSDEIGSGHFVRAFTIISELQKKHPEFTNSEQRYQIICKLIDELNKED